METETLKRGRGTVKLIKSDNLIAIRPTSQAEVTEVLAAAPVASAQVEVGPTLGGFHIVKLSNTKDEMESTLNELRRHYLVDSGSHVYHTASNTAPIVPTGKIALRFTAKSSQDQRQQVLDQHHLEIVDSIVKDRPDGSKVETYTVRTTPEALNPLKVAEALQKATDVVSMAEPDLATPGRLFAFQLPSDALLQEQWHLKNNGMQFGTSLGLKAGADARVVAAWERMQSLGSPACIVAVIDDGFDLTHPDLSGNSKVVAPWDFTSNTDNPAPRRFDPDPRRGDYHGTACAGVAIGNANGGGIIGAAPGARFMPVRWTSSISDETIKKQFAYVAAQGAWVVSCSWGVASAEFFLSTEMDEAISECATQGRNGLGCVVVFAAGNANHDINDPAGGTVDGFATHPDVIAVAACNSRDQKSNYSNFGREISICAPSSGTGGRGILTSDVRGTFEFQGATYEAGYEAGDYTKTFGGTSSATPLVAGICALVLSANPALTAKEVKSILERTARKIGNPDVFDSNGHSVLFGHGCVNADEAVRAALEQLGPANRTVVTANTAPPDPELTRANTTLMGSEFWGIPRHELIAGAASALLKQPAMDQIAQLVAPLGNGTTLRDLAAWADLIKGESANSGQDADTQDFLTRFPNDASRDWHYVNLPLGVASYAEAAKLHFTRDDDVVRMLTEAIRVLQDRSSVMGKLSALRWITHLVGDVHQPVHVGCGFIDASGATPQLVTDPHTIRDRGLPHDKGGNDLLLPVSGTVTLHSYWDSRLPGEILDPDDQPNETAAETSAIDKEGGITPALKTRFIGKLTGQIQRELAARRNTIVPATTTPPEEWPEQWANASLVGARQAYESLRIVQKSGNKFKVSWEGKAAYDSRCSPIVSQRLTAATQNLAALLNAIWP